jgi:putative addiction module component (TIGR02574 family)
MCAKGTEMTTEANKLLENALRLPEADRADLATKLLDSLDPESEEDVETAWAQEIEKRLDDLDQSKVRTIPWLEVRRRLMGDGDESAKR